MMHSKMRNNAASLEFEKLVTLWHNALSYRNPRKGNIVRDIVEQEWKRREIDLHERSNGFVPETGLLAALGYRVGSTRGLKTELRQAILTRVYYVDLPLVYSRSYMAQWGKPKSSQRRRKLTNTLIGFIESKNGQSCFEKAVRDWSEDLDYLHEHIF
jgi:hypothetical protein